MGPFLNFLKQQNSSSLVLMFMGGSKSSYCKELGEEAYIGDNLYFLIFFLCVLDWCFIHLKPFEVQYAVDLITFSISV